jgi:hypothetical protein
MEMMIRYNCREKYHVKEITNVQGVNPGPEDESEG